jgi:hypothetical protein
MNQSNPKNIKKILTVALTSITLALTQFAYANSNPRVYVDVYGTNKLSAEDIKNKFGEDMMSLASLYIDPKTFTEKSKKSEPMRNRIKNGINSMGAFSYVNVSMMKFPNNKNAYYTIDIVEKKDQRRLGNFLTKPSRYIPDPEHLIALWKEYQEKGYVSFFSKDKAKVDLTSCPAFNCTLGFDALPLKKYKAIFGSAVPRNKDKLIAILHEDQDPDKRATAALLLAHIKDGKELIDNLVPAMDDADMKVRSTAMQVLAGALHTVKTSDIPLDNVINALDRPDLEERNKALTLLYVLSLQTANDNYIKEHAKAQLIVQLKMEQPYVHDQAYLILKQISGLKFGERDYQAWDNWLNTNKTV